MKIHVIKENGDYAALIAPTSLTTTGYKPIVGGNKISGNYETTTLSDCARGREELNSHLSLRTVQLLPQNLNHGDRLQFDDQDNQNNPTGVGVLFVYEQKVDRMPTKETKSDNLSYR